MQAGRCAFSLHCKTGLYVIVCLCAQERYRLEIRGIDRVSKRCCSFVVAFSVASQDLLHVFLWQIDHDVHTNIRLSSTRSGASLRTVLGDIADGTQGGEASHHQQ